MDVRCVSCNSNNIVCLGEIPERNTFFANSVIKLLPQTFLFGCKNCRLYFKFPRIQREELEKMYVSGNPEIWQYGLGERKDWQISIKWLMKEDSKGCILDVGCWDGGFLENVKNMDRYGIEINPEAIIKAQSKGIKIIGENIYQRKKISMKFNVVTAFDVVEHIENPFDFLQAIASLTIENGKIIISSGNTEAWNWRICKSKYYYCAIPEHISFINIQWIRRAAKKLNLSIEYVGIFSHKGNSGPWRPVLEPFNNFLYFLFPKYFISMRRLYKNKYMGDRFSYPPVWRSAKDHLIVILRKD